MKGTLESAVTDDRAKIEASTPSIPRRDWIIIPLISLLTLLVPTLLGESIARLLWTEKIEDSCRADNPFGLRHIPNCTTFLKIPEGPAIQYHYNECGFRGSDPCGPKQPGTARFVLIGTSIASGMHVAEGDMFTALVAPELSTLLGRKVQFQNLGSLPANLSQQYDIDDEVLSLNPDGVIFLVVPYDLVRLDFPPVYPTANAPSPAKPRVPDLMSIVRSSRLLVLFEHLILRDEYYAERAYILKGSPDDASRMTPSPLAQKRYDVMNQLIHRVAADLRRGGVPLIMVPFPNRLQSIAISHHTQAPGLEADGFSRRIGVMARDAGAEFIDVVPILKRSHNVGEMFYTVDGHLNGRGHKVIAEAMLNYFKTRPAGQ